MASKTPIEVRMVSWFALAPADEARKQFLTIRALLADRGLLGKGKAKASTNVAKAAARVNLKHTTKGDPTNTIIKEETIEVPTTQVTQ